MSSSQFLHRLNDHEGAVKALAWCPYEFDVLASGGGTMDCCIKMWNTQKGCCIISVDGQAQVCSLEWDRHHKEILSGRALVKERTETSCACGGTLPCPKLERRWATRPESFSLHRAQITVLWHQQEQMRQFIFWEIFGPPLQSSNSAISKLDGFLTLESSPIRSKCSLYLCFVFCFVLFFFFFKSNFVQKNENIASRRELWGS